MSATGSIQSRDATSGSSISFSRLVAVVFLVSAGTMMIELAAGRVIARHLGASLYTWTSVIGVVLTGLAIGNYLGGLLADRRSNAESLAGMLVFAALSCSLSPILDQVAAGMSSLWMLSWPARTAAHMAVTYMLAAISLGMIAPVVAKIALDSGIPRGRAIGVLSAAGAVGSIVGTFSSGYFLIEWIGTLGVPCAVAVLFILLACSLTISSRPVIVGSVIAIVPVLWIWQATGFSAANSTRLWPFGGASDAESLIVFSRESAYSYVEVYKFSRDSTLRGMKLDALAHSELDLEAPDELEYEYQRIFHAITNRLFPSPAPVSTLTIGGGGYVFPRLLAEHRPGSRTDIVEIDPVVTEAAYEAFGLPRSLDIRCFHEDGRVFIDRLIAERTARSVEAPSSTTDRSEGTQPAAPAPYDIIYLDALSGYQVPHQLTTREFARRCHSLIRPGGAYLIEMIDIFEPGAFLGSVVKTLRQEFSYVYVLLEPLEGRDWKVWRKPFVVAAMDHPLDASGIGAEYSEDCEIMSLASEELDALVGRPQSVLLTDEFAPVENLLAPVVLQASADRAVVEWLRRIRSARESEQNDAALKSCDEALRANWSPIQRAELLAERAGVLAALHRYAEAEETGGKALDLRPDEASLLSTIADVQIAQGDRENGVKTLRRLIALEPSAANQYRLVEQLIAMQRYAEAEPEAALLIRMDPAVAAGYSIRATCLERLGRLDEARSTLRRYLDAYPDASPIAEELRRLESDVRSAPASP